MITKRTMIFLSHQIFLSLYQSSEASLSYLEARQIFVSRDTSHDLKENVNRLINFTSQVRVFQAVARKNMSGNQKVKMGESYLRMLQDDQDTQNTTVMAPKFQLHLEVQVQLNLYILVIDTLWLTNILLFYSVRPRLTN